MGWGGLRNLQQLSSQSRVIIKHRYPLEEVVPRDTVELSSENLESSSSPMPSFCLIVVIISSIYLENSDEEDGSSSGDKACFQGGGNTTDSHEMSEAECDRDYHQHLRKMNIARLVWRRLQTIDTSTNQNELSDRHYRGMNVIRSKSVAGRCAYMSIWRPLSAELFAPPAPRVCSSVSTVIHASCTALPPCPLFNNPSFAGVHAGERGGASADYLPCGTNADY
ncbi:hypothetical protein CEXT_504581 [Caerostris extrusa]|uniref:Uncharacterized protein n=1 Tax=Caerostris extrusa TaxID=172846 RepID=A0AAV4UN34_CAEEX|nr:hypothetical protein CEXT_504581 [Caerostris extrusa]